MAKDNEFEQQANEFLDAIHTSSEIRQMIAVFNKAVLVLPGPCDEFTRAKQFKLFTAGVLEGIRIGSELK